MNELDVNVVLVRLDKIEEYMVLPNLSCKNKK
ncbi:hypothetical protein PCC8801_4483 (plasmid) [Rippkaea orientalis PCC 8801]|uniref:Uncharacterized protein n=1 Tax=Rippkaea orientalis (strain PCC 8801 / RF-1) TaxID=41431 RepID=B7K6H7_RIPO1|nr:hypothetical protein PCC8801_4483 [Rippkaea orientalis PCC 8801]